MNKTKYKLKELGEYKNGANYPRGSYGAGDKIVNVKDLFRGRFISFNHLDELKSGSLKNKNIYLVEHGDLLFTRSSLVKSGAGMVAMVNHPQEDILFCGFIIRYRPNTSKVNPLYLLYLLRSPNYRKLFTDGSVQTNISNINQDTLGNIEVELPDLDGQKNIVNILNICDSKIELNLRINAELDSMAKTLFDFWFVQFNFSDNKGEPYKSSGGKMVWNSELKRETPEGWKVGTLLDIAEYFNGLPCQKYRPTGNDFLKVIKIKEMHAGFSAETEFVRPDIPQKAIIENGDVLFSWSASLEVQIWSRGKGALNQHIFKVTSDKYPKSFYYYQLLNYLQHFKMMAQNRKTTMGHITQEHLQQSRIVLPPEELKDIMLKCEEIIAPIFEKKINNDIENQKLMELRDWLLPMLMNGQVTVN